MAERGESRVGEKFSLLTRDAKLVLAYLFLNTIPIGYMNVIPLIYLINIGYSPATVSLIYAASAISNTIGLTPFGILADKFGRKKFLIIGSVIPAISYVIFGLTLNPYWLVAASAVGGVGYAGGLAVAVSGPALLPIVADTVPSERRTRIFGAFQAIWTISLTLGAFLSVLPDLFRTQLNASDYFAHSLSYYIMAVLIVVSIFPLFFVHERRSVSGEHPARGNNVGMPLDHNSPRNAPSNPKTRPRFVSGKEIKKFSVVYCLAGLGLGVCVQLVASWYSLQFGTTEPVAGFWIAIAELLSASSILIIPYFVKTRGTLQAAVITQVISAIFLALMPLSGIFLFAALLFVFRNIFSNVSWSILQSYVMGVVDEKERAAATGIASTAWGVANSVGTISGGWLFASGLLSLPFVIGFFAYAGSSIALGYLFRGVKPPEEISVPDRQIV